MTSDLVTISIGMMLLALAGCNTIEHPLFISDDSVAVEGLEGKWLIEHDDVATSGVVVISKIKDRNKYRVKPIDAGSISEQPIEAVAGEIAGVHYLDVYTPNAPQHGHAIFKLARHKQDRFILTVFDVEQARGSKHLTHKIEPLHLDLKSGGMSIPIPVSLADSGVRITATTDELQAFFESHPNLYWGSQFRLKPSD